MAKGKKAEGDTSEGASELLAYLQEREAHHIAQAEASAHTARSYQRACVKDKAVHLALQERWHRAEAAAIRGKIDALS